MPVIDFESCISTNALHLGELQMEAYNDRMIVVEDEFRSGYECKACSGSGRITCVECSGRGWNKTWVHKSDNLEVEDGLQKKCSYCDGRGWFSCSDCGGKGEMLVIPDSTKRRPTTGRIVSVGNLVSTTMHAGESVLYPSFCGHVFDLNAVDENGEDVKIAIRIIRESEVISKVSGHLDLRRVASRVSAPDAV